MRIFILLLSFANLYCHAHRHTTLNPVVNEIGNGEKRSALITDTIETKIGAEFNIEIRAALSTGKQWMLEDSLDKDHLAMIRSTIVTDSTEMAAKPDLQTFVFKALKKGSTTISFINKRPWKKNADANDERKKYVITIT